MRRRRPVVVLLDGADKDELGPMLRLEKFFYNFQEKFLFSSLRDDSAAVAADASPPPAMCPYPYGDEDILFAVLLQKVPNERRLRRMAKLGIQQVGQKMHGKCQS